MLGIRCEGLLFVWARCFLGRQQCAKHSGTQFHVRWRPVLETVTHSHSVSAAWFQCLEIFCSLTWPTWQTYLGTFAKLPKATTSFMSVCPSVRMEQLGSHWTDFYEIWCLSIFRKSVEKIQVSFKSDNNNGTLHDDLCTFMITSRWILLRIRNVSHKNSRENQNTFYVQ